MAISKLMKRRSRADRWGHRRGLGNGTGLRLEALEPRTVLSVVAIGDIYAATEDIPPNTAAVTVIPQYASGWFFNDELSMGVNQYPTDAAGRHWAARDYDISTSRMGANPSLWDGAVPGPFDCRVSECDNRVNAFSAVPLTVIHVAPGAENTFLLRRKFTLDPASAAAVWGRITYTCDSGCIMYVNGVRAASSPNMAGILSPTPNTFAADEGDEELPHATVTFGLNGSGQPPLYEGANVLAAEVHNFSVVSGDIGGDFSLAIAPEGGSVLTNDNLASQTGPLVLTKLSDPVDETIGYPAGTVALNTDVLSPDFGRFAYAPAANYCGTASWTYQIDDSSLRPSTGNVRFNVACVNDPPVARNDFYSVKMGAVLNVTTAAGGDAGLLANDTDVEGDTLTVQTVDISAVAAQGTLNVNANGTFTFAPYATALPGTYRFTYQVVDNGTPSATSNVATVEITITPGCEANPDLDQNGQVGSADLAILVANLGSRAATPDQGDLNCDGKVGLTDLVALKRQWTPRSPSASAASVIRSAGFSHDLTTRLPRVHETQRLSATRSSVVAEAAAAVVYRQTAPETASADAALSQRYLATRLRAGCRAINPRPHAIDAAFSAWEPT